MPRLHRMDSGENLILKALRSDRRQRIKVQDSEAMKELQESKKIQEMLLRTLDRLDEQLKRGTHIQLVEVEAVKGSNGEARGMKVTTTALCQRRTTGILNLRGATGTGRGRRLLSEFEPQSSLTEAINLFWTL